MLFEDFILVHAADRDFGSRNQRQVTPFNGIDLRRIATRNEADPLQNFVTGKVGRNDGHETLLPDTVHRVLDECQFEQYRFVLEKVEAGSGNFATPFHVDQVEPFAKFEMIEWFEVELARLAPPENFPVSILARRHGCVRVSHIRDAQLLGT